MSTPSRPPTDTAPRRGVHLVLAVKNLVDAKSRLSTTFPGDERAELVLAMLRDTASAAAAADVVTGWSVVTPDARVASVAVALGGHTVSEPESGAATTVERLNRALSAADDAISDAHGGDVIALQADLPALRTAELVAAYAAAPPDTRSVVIDHTGTGTSALIVRGRPRRLEPRFGPDSASRHVDSGAFPLLGTWPGLRLDVDTADDVRAALDLGVGPHTAAMLAELGWTAAR
ncbi:MULTISPECIES: 2-phospho-L-lactate guanylyltransferase [Nocardiaceae]|uniref:Phosphoenolpyruvate guanylyltransferase n=1 Tax=Rhodococcoides corynebacterioides TaxID=53972 RepID=A0ABS2KSX3_9NOCA|nr:MULTISPECIES: 2-phospho-L-lactate guanylyltransferase [Rhodococcus]MBM7415022.1 2-phospho-L-lactate guanylyltransferase [Rhodococcus corynebacterioides]MBP1117484.1 2-phospho-L-lactate guanylyltransferase [Rhodococcus sp. PvP016]